MEVSTRDRKLEALQDLYAEWVGCERCGLCDPQGRERKHVMFGEGDVDADVVIIGLAPDEASEGSGEMYAGDDGGVLDTLLASHNSSRDDVFLMPLVACWPTKPAAAFASRPPTKKEIAACSERVSAILQIIDPYVVILLGDTTIKALTGTKDTMAKARDRRRIFSHRAQVQGRMVPISWRAYGAHDLDYLATHWSEEEGGHVHYSFQVWERAFAIADACAELYRGVTPPQRSEHE